MKNKLLLTVAMAAVTGVASAGTIATPYIAGDWQGWDATANPMIETTGGSDIWTLNVSGLVASSRHEFKVAEFEWANSYPGANSWLIADGAGDITITYDGNTYADGWLTTADRIGVDYDPGTWTTVGGGFWGGIGGSDWNNADAAGAMVDQGGGIYSLTINDVAEGSYDWKVVMTGTWDAIGSDGRNVNAGNMGFSTTATDNDVTFSVNALTGVTNVEVIPEPATLGLITLFGAGLLFARRKLLL